MAEKWQDLALLSEVYPKLMQMVDEHNTTRRQWHANHDGPRCYHSNKSWNHTGNGAFNEEPGTGSAWTEVSDTSVAVTYGAITSPLAGSTLAGDSATFQWVWASDRTPQTHQFRLLDDGVSVYNSFGAGTSTSKAVSNIPTDSSVIGVELTLNYATGTPEVLTENYVAASAGSGSVGAWIAPVSGGNQAGTSIFHSWDHGTKTASSWTLTITNTSTSNVLQTYNGTTGTLQTVTGLPDDGSIITATLNVNYTDSTSHTIGTTYTNGVASAVAADITFNVSGSTYSGEVVVTGAVPRWKTSVGEVTGAIQSSQPKGTTGIEVFDQGGTIVGINLPNIGMTTLTTDPSVAPIEINLSSNSALSLPVGSINLLSATKIDFKDVGSNVFLRDQDITQAGMKHFNICNCQDQTVSSTAVGQMGVIEYLCLQGINFPLTDADMSAANYNQMHTLLIGYNSSMAIGRPTLDKMPNLQIFQCPSSAINVVAGMFLSKPVLSNITVEGRVATTTEMNAVLSNIRVNADNFNIDNGTLRILTGNPTPTGGASNADILALQGRSWSVT